MKRFNFRFPTTLFRLIAIGIALGYLARIVVGPPASAEFPDRKFREPLVEPVEEFIDLPIIKRTSPE